MVAGLLVALAVVAMSGVSADPDMLQDVCVADLKSAIHVNGFGCKPMSQVTPDDFFTTAISSSGDTTNKFGSAVTGAAVDKVPGLNTLGVSMARIDYAPHGLNPPHVHPRATEMVFVLYGELDVGFVTTGNILISKKIKAGETFVFPKGLVHYQKNNCKDKPAAVVSAFNSQFPGTQKTAISLFASEPAVPSDVLGDAFQIGERHVEKIRDRLSA